MTNRKKLIVAIAVALGVFLGALDTTIVGTAMPTVIASLGGLSLYSWVFASYMLASTVATPIFGKLSDLFGRRRLFIIAVVIFLGGSVLSASARTMEQLIIFRGLQGIGGGGLFALAFTIIGAIFTPVERPRYQGMISAVWAIASIVGPTTGGFIVDNLGWRWTFYVNLPIGVIPVALVLYALHERQPAGKSRYIDYWGAALLSGSITALLVGLLQGGQAAPWLSVHIVGLFAAAALLLVAFVLAEMRSPEPMVPLGLFNNRTFASSNAGGFLTGLALFGTAGFVPLFVQGVLGSSATTAGAALTPMSLGWPLGSVVAGQTVNWLGYRNIVVGGLVLMTFGFYLLTGISPVSDPSEVARDVFVIGLGMGFIAPTLLVAVQNNVPRNQLGAATSAAQFFRSIGGTIGVSLMGAMMANVVYSDIASAGRQGLLSGFGNLGMNLGDPQILLNADSRAGLPAAVLQLLQGILAHALHDTFVVGLIACAAGFAAVIFVSNSTPSKDMAREHVSAQQH